MSGKKGMGHYPAEMKVEAVRLFYEKGKTVQKSRMPWSYAIPSASKSGCGNIVEKVRKVSTTP